MDTDIAIVLLFIVIVHYYGFYKLLKRYKNLQKEKHFLTQYTDAIEKSNIVSRTDSKGNITYVNDKFCEVTMYSKDEILGKSYSLLLGENSPEILKDLNTIKDNKKEWQGILKNKKKNGEFYYVNIIIKPILDENNEIIEYIAIRHEITDLINKSNELEETLREDFLTKQGNRFKLIEDIKKSEKPFLALVDINQFSEINDFYGHAIGDEILKILAKIIRNLLNESYYVYRVYSDEFAILSDNKLENEFIEKIKFICDEVSSYPIKIRNKEIYIELSQSISFEEKENLIKTADIIKKYSKKISIHIFMIKI